MEIHVPSAPKRLKITDTMICDFLVDPVLGAKVIMGADLDDFQKARLRTYWWVPEVMDSSGFSSAKTITFWIWVNLRACLIADQHIGVFYQTFDSMKLIFWPYYRSPLARAPIFAAQIGKVDELGEDGKAANRGAACYTYEFKNESKVMMPAPDWKADAKSKAGLRFNAVGLDEFAKVEATGSQGINQQILGRLTRPCFNQHHPIWMNHLKMLSTAQSMSHAAAKRYKAFHKRQASGDPHCTTITYSYKDYSRKKLPNGKTFAEEYRMESTLKSMKAQLTREHFLQEGLGVWQRLGKGWYSELVMDMAVQAGKNESSEVIMYRNQSQIKEETRYFLGADPAPSAGKKADDGVLAVGRARRRPDVDPSYNPQDWIFEPVFAYKCKALSAEQWAGLIHLFNDRFNLDGILMDPGGGGYWIQQELKKDRALIQGVHTAVKPIVTVETIEPSAQMKLCIFKRGDNGIETLWPKLKGDDNLKDSQHVVMHEVFENGRIAWPPPMEDRDPEVKLEIESQWDQERQWALKLLSIGLKQFQAISVAINDDGSWVLTRNGARVFVTSSKDDVAYAVSYAYIRFLIWLKKSEIGGAYEEEDAACTTW